MPNNADMVKVKWYCSYYVGPAHWHGTERYEPDECCTEFETVENYEEFTLKLCTAECPSCHSVLNQYDDDPELAEVNA